MAGTRKRIAGPAYLTNSAANVYSPPASTMLLVIHHIRLVNTDSSARTVTLYIGATGASTGGTELLSARSIAANDSLDLYFPELVMKSTDFLVGLADTTNKVTITVMGEQVVVP